MVAYTLLRLPFNCNEKEPAAEFQETIFHLIWTIYQRHLATAYNISFFNLCSYELTEDDLIFDKTCSLFHYHLKSDRKWLAARVNNFSHVIRVYSPYKCFNDVTSSSE